MNYSNEEIILLRNATKGIQLCTLHAYTVWSTWCDYLHVCRSNFFADFRAKSYSLQWYFSCLTYSAAQSLPTSMQHMYVSMVSISSLNIIYIPEPWHGAPFQIQLFRTRTIWLVDQLCNCTKLHFRIMGIREAHFKIFSGFHGTFCGYTFIATILYSCFVILIIMKI